MNRTTTQTNDMTTTTGRARLAIRLAQRAASAPASALQDRVDECVREEDALLARRHAARVARLPLGERLSGSQS